MLAIHKKLVDITVVLNLDMIAFVYRSEESFFKSGILSLSCYYKDYKDIRFSV